MDGFNTDQTRRALLRGLMVMAGAAALPATVMAQAARFQGRELVATAFGGPSQEILQRVVFDWLGQTQGGRAIQTPLLSAQAFARMRAEAQNPQIDVFMFSGGQERIAKTEGLTQPITAGPNLAQVPAAMRDADGHWATWGVVAEGILYRSDKIRTPPTSYRDFFKPEYEGHIAFPHITNGYGMDFLVMLARTFGGSEKAIDPGFEAIKRIAPRATIFRSAAEVQPLFAQGDVWIMPYDNASALRSSRQGIPVAYATPAEGAPAVVLTTCIAKGSRNGEMASALIDRLLSADSQIPIASEVAWAPSNAGVTLPAEVASFFPPLAQLKELDRDTINAMRPAWTDRYNREVAR
jgi:putative spermidine/putrescine transport system substrate-binding protein